MALETIRVEFQDTLCVVEIHRPEAMNAINARLIAEITGVLAECEEKSTIVVLRGSPEVFCFGADFGAIADPPVGGADGEGGPAALFDLWSRLASGPYVTVSYVRGRVNAGGIGFVAASDIALADATAKFSLSELLFGLHPACVMPFLMRRIGLQRSHYLTLMTQPFDAADAFRWGLVDAHDADGDSLLRRHLLRLRRLSKPAIRRYKDYMRMIGPPLSELRSNAIAANTEVFSDAQNLAAIARYLQLGVFPWEKT